VTANIRSYAFRFGCALVAVGVATAVRWLLEPLLSGHATLLMFAFAVVVAGWWGGIGAGLAATALSEAVAAFLFSHGLLGLRLDAPSFQTQLALLFVIGIAISALAESMHRGLRREQEQRIAARESEARFAALFRGNPLPLVILDYADGRVVDLNDAAVRAFGYGRDAAIGALMSDLNWFVDATRSDALFERLASDGRVVGLDIDLRRRDGASRRYSISAEFIDAPRGPHVALTAYDLTERLAADELSRKNEAFLRSVIDNLYAFVGVLAPDGTLLEANLAPLRAADIRFEDVVGKKFWDCYWWSYDPAIQAQLRAAIASAALGQVSRYDVEVRMAGGTTMPIDFMLAPLRDEDGRVTHLIPSAIPIIERRQAEAARRALAAIVESSTDAIIGKSLDGTITSWNGGAERLFGYSADEAIARSIMMLVPVERHVEEAGFIERLSRGVGVSNFATVRRHREGFPIDVSLSISPIHDEAGRVVGASTIARDIREQQRAEQLLREQAAALRDADARKDDFLAMLAHELRNPLAPVRTVSYLLGHTDPSPAEVARFGGILARQVAHLTRMVDDLLDISRITRGKITLDRARVSLVAAVAHAVETTRPFLDARRHELTVKGPDVPVWLNGDATRLSQVVANLLHNAAKYTPEGGRIEVEVSLAANVAQIRVRDNGTGIDAEFLPHVFEPFRQADTTLDRAHGGLGLGLTLARHLAELHGGTIEAASAGRGLGSEFVLRVPALPGPGSDAGSAHANATAGAAQRVLLVEDNRDVAETLAAVLRLQGHAVCVAGDGDQAFAAIRDHYDPTVVVLDIGLPGMDGYDIARRLRTLDETQRARLIALTGYGQFHDRALAMAAGFDHHMVKPADVDELLAHIAAGAHATA